MGLEPSRWCKFCEAKGHHTDDCYQLKNEIYHLIQDVHVKKNAKGYAQTTYGSSSRGQDAFRCPRSKKGKEISNGGEDKTVEI